MSSGGKWNWGSKPAPPSDGDSYEWKDDEVAGPSSSGRSGAGPGACGIDAGSNLTRSSSSFSYEHSPVDEDDWDWADGETTPPVVVKKPLQLAHPTLNYYLADGDVLRECPYETNHQVLEKRFITHLYKCQRNYKLKRLRNPNLEEINPCRYNWSHHVRASEEDEHLKVCEDYKKSEVDRLEEKAREEERAEQRRIKEEAEQEAAAKASLAKLSTAFKGSGHSVISQGGQSEVFYQPTILERRNFDGIAGTSTSQKKADDSTDWNDDGEWAEDPDRPPEDFDMIELDEFGMRIQRRHSYYMPPGMSKSQRKLFRKRNLELFEKEKADREEKKAEEALARAALQAQADKERADAGKNPEGGFYKRFD